jgi:RNA polymerase sigma-70 factor (ECF subfamily)
MPQDDSLAVLLARFRVRDETAAAELCQRFTNRLIALARSHLDSWVRRKVDPEDVVQSVYRSFFTRLDAGQFDFASWNELWGLLTVITVRKCVNRAEHFRTQGRDAAREVNAELDSRCQPVDPEPTPEEALLLTETVEQVMRGLDADDREIVALSLQGYTVREISDQVGRAERTVRWVRQGVRKRLEKMHDESVQA